MWNVKNWNRLQYWIISTYSVQDWNRSKYWNISMWNVKNWNRLKYWNIVPTRFSTTLLRFKPDRWWDALLKRMGDAFEMVELAVDWQCLGMNEWAILWWIMLCFQERIATSRGSENVWAIYLLISNWSKSAHTSPWWNWYHLRCRDGKLAENWEEITACQWALKRPHYPNFSNRVATGRIGVFLSL